MTSEIGPDYRQVTNLIRDKIASGNWPVGSQIPSTAELREMTGLSITSVRRGVQQLQAGGVLEGHPGKGVFVKALPEDADRERANVEAVVGQMAELRQEVRHLAERAEKDDDLRARVEQLEARLGRMEADVLYLYNRDGIEYDHGDEHDGAEKTAGRRRSRR